MRHLLPLTLAGLVALFLSGCVKVDTTSADFLTGQELGCTQASGTWDAKNRVCLPQPATSSGVAGDNAVKDTGVANFHALPKKDFSYLEETLDPKITGTAKLIGPAATDGTKLDPIALSKLCSKNAQEEKKCADALKNFDVHAGYIEYERPYATRATADPKLFPDEKSKERGFQWYILWEQWKNPTGPVELNPFTKATTNPSENLFIWFNGGPGSPPTFGGWTGVYPMLIDLDPNDPTIQTKPRLYLNEWQINKYGALVTVDTPRLVGYSNKNGYQAADPFQLPKKLDHVTQDFLSWIDKFFEQHPNMRARKFYLIGESFGGQYISRFGQAIVKRNRLLKSKGHGSDHPKYIDLRAVMGGNATFAALGNQSPFSELNFFCGALNGKGFYHQRTCLSVGLALFECAPQPKGEKALELTTLFKLSGPNCKQQSLTSGAATSGTSCKAGPAKGFTGESQEGAAAAAPLELDCGCANGSRQEKYCCAAYCALSVGFAPSTDGLYENGAKTVTKRCETEAECRPCGDPAKPTFVGVDSERCDKQRTIVTVAPKGIDQSVIDGRIAKGLNPNFPCITALIEQKDIPPSADGTKATSDVCVMPVNGQVMPPQIGYYKGVWEPSQHPGDPGVKFPNYLFLEEECANNGMGYFPPICRDLGPMVKLFNQPDVKKVFKAFPTSEFLLGNFWVWNTLLPQQENMWESVSDIMKSGIPVTLYYGKDDASVSAPRGYGEGDMVRRWYNSTTDNERLIIENEVPLAEPAQLDAWPMHRDVNDKTTKMGEYHIYPLNDGAQKLRYVQLDDVGHEVPLISRAKFAELFKEMIEWSPPPPK